MEADDEATPSPSQAGSPTPTPTPTLRSVCCSYIKGDWSAWRLYFNGGLLLGGLLAARLAPSAFETPASTFGVGRAAAAGLLVGLGTSMGNGCTR
jgi:uncharacterized membrane protein YedE/YeeE